MVLDRIHRIHLKGDLGRAERLYKEFLQGSPPDPLAEHLLGTLYLQQNQNGLAARHLRRALEMQKTTQNYTNLLVALRGLGRAEEAVEIGQEAIYLWGREHKELKSFYSNLASCHMELGQYDVADTILRAVIDMDKDDIDANWNHGVCQLTQGNLEAGWAGYDFGFKAKERGAPEYFNEFKEWLGEDLTGKTILIWGEQGLGDEILFANVLNDVIKVAGRVILDCHPRLEELFKRSFACEVVGGRKDKTRGRWDHEHIDLHCPIGSLPRFFRSELSDFPKQGYLKADPARVKYWRTAIPGFKVGLAWMGGVHKTGRNMRSIALRDLLPPIDNVSFVSLQYGHVYEEVSQFPIYHNEGVIEDFTELANLTAACDLVISVIQTSVHLAGALDVPTWCLTPYAPPWKFMKGERIPWHPSVKQYHQEKRGDWTPVVNRIHSDLLRLVEERIAA